jgi:hypothetical protein
MPQPAEIATLKTGTPQAPEAERSVKKQQQKQVPNQKKKQVKQVLHCHDSNRATAHLHAISKSTS